MEHLIILLQRLQWEVISLASLLKIYKILIIKGNGYTEQADIWSLGMMVYELYHGFPPFFSKDKKKQIESCVSKDIMINSKIHVDTQDFIRKLL